MATLQMRPDFSISEEPGADLRQTAGSAPSTAARLLVSQRGINARPRPPEKEELVREHHLVAPAFGDPPFEIAEPTSNGRDERRSAARASGQFASSCSPLLAILFRRPAVGRATQELEISAENEPTRVEAETRFRLGLASNDDLEHGA